MAWFVRKNTIGGNIRCNVDSSTGLGRETMKRIPMKSSVKNRKTIIFLFFFIISSVVCFSGPGYSVVVGEETFKNIVLPQELEKEEIAFTVKGKIGKTKIASFDLKTLERFPKMSFTTWDPWDAMKREYEGVLLSDILRFLKIDSSATRIEIYARNDYKTIIGVEDLPRVGYLLAYKMDGKYFKEWEGKSNKGPIAIAIDFDSHKDIDINIYKENLVWWVDIVNVE